MSNFETLRHGIEVNEKQSFIACISDLIFYAKKVLDKNGKPTDKFAKILSIKEMRERIISSLKLDNFIEYQNGNLVADFHNINQCLDQIVDYREGFENLTVDLDYMYQYLDHIVDYNDCSGNFDYNLVDYH